MQPDGTYRTQLAFATTTTTAYALTRAAEEWRAAAARDGLTPIGEPTAEVVDAETWLMPASQYVVEVTGRTRERHADAA